jgi:RND family efflux transporter MFP subunit
MLMLAACTPAPKPVAEVAPVYVTPVHNDVGEGERRFTGTVSPRFESDLSFRAAGKVTARLVDVGQSVRQGQVLARLDPVDYQLGANAAAEQWRAAQVDADQASSDAARFRRLLADGSVAAADLERQQARTDAAAARVAQARSQLDVARNRVGYATLVAPFDGLVTGVRFEAGQVVGEGQPVLALARPGALDVVVDVPESLASELRTFQASARTGEGRNVAIEVQLRELAPTASAATRTFRARYTITASPAVAALRLGSTVELRLARSGTSRSASLPLGALLSTDQSPSVWVVDTAAGTLKRQPVEVLAQTDDTVRVRGLPDGVLIVSVGAQKLDAAMKVRAVARPLSEAIASPPPAAASGSRP